MCYTMSTYTHRRAFEYEYRIFLKPSGSQEVWNEEDNNPLDFNDQATLNQVNTPGALVRYCGKCLQILHTLKDNSVICAMWEGDGKFPLFRYRGDTEVYVSATPKIRKLCRGQISQWTDKISGGYCILRK